MYEWDLVEQAVRTLSSLAEGRPVREVEIALGPGVDRSKAVDAWRALTGSTPLAGAHVTWEEATDLLRCEQCGHEYTDTGGVCPYCGGDGVVIEPASPISLGRCSFEETRTGSERPSAGRLGATPRM